MEENYLHNTTQCNLYLALFPSRNTGQSGGAQKCSFGPNAWEVNPYHPGLLLPAYAATGCKLRKYSSGVAICQVVFWTLVPSEPCFLQALGWCLVLVPECLSPAP